MDIPSLFAARAAFENEYIAAVKGGANPKELTVFPYVSAIAPSPALYAITKLGGAMRDKPAAEAFSEPALPFTRAFLSKYYAVYAGELELPAVPADDLKAEYGVGAFWVSWPGVDTSAAAPTVLHFHGGAMVFGDALVEHGFLGRLSRETGLRVLSVDYPLAPDSSVPASIEVCVKAYRYMTETLKVNPKDILVTSGATSAALLTIQSIIKKGLPVPGAAWLIEPVCRNDAKGIADVAECRTDALYADPGDTNTFFVRYLRHEGHPDELPIGDAGYSPYNGDFAGFPPTFISYDAQSSLSKGVEGTIEKMRAAGVTVASSATQFGVILIALFNCLESFHELAIATTWVKQHLGASSKTA